MHTIFLRSATIISITAATILAPMPALAQITTRPDRPVAPPAPIKPMAPIGPMAPRAPNSPAWSELDRNGALASGYGRLELDKLRDMRIDMVDRIYDVAPLFDGTLRYAARTLASMSNVPPAPWAKDDPADSLYRVARESLNSGEYRRAAQLFAQISRQYPASRYRSEANYWRAFALYRIGGIADLHEALQVLDSAGKATAAAAPRPAKPLTLSLGDSASWKAFTLVGRRSSDTDAAILAMRIRGALAARGDATAAAQIARSADASATSCDDEDAQIRVEALNALVQMDPKNAEPAVTKVLARRDPCSAPLRRGALGLIARSNDAHSTDMLIGVAQSDPDLSVRGEAIRLLGRASDDRATSALTQIATSSDKPPLQRIAVRALAAQESPAARQSIRNLMTRTDVSPDVRITALHYAGKSDLQVADLTSMYDAATDRWTREEIISLLEQRQEPQAADKLIDIAKTSTDPSLRRRAIEALSQKKDPRTTKLLMDILGK
jgi:HEAT repeat protein